MEWCACSLRGDLGTLLLAPFGTWGCVWIVAVFLGRGVRFAEVLGRRALRDGISQAVPLYSIGVHVCTCISGKRLVGCASSFAGRSFFPASLDWREFLSTLLTVRPAVHIGIVSCVKLRDANVSSCLLLTMIMTMIEK